MSTGKANALVHALYNKVVTDVITKSRVRSSEGLPEPLVRLVAAR